MTSMLLQLSMATVQLPAWFGDNMVLQTNKEYGARSFLSGRADAGEAIYVTGGAGNYQTTADKFGTWKVQLDPLHDDGGLFSITVAGDDPRASVTAHNVTAGDVFFCSGQSNMVFPLKLAFNATAEAKTLPPPFRFFMTGRDYQAEPQWTLSSTPKGCESTSWDGKGKCNRWVHSTEAAANSSKYLLDFSAVCFMTARDIARMHTANRPMGLIQSAWGGTRVEAWMSSESLRTAGPPVSGHVPNRTTENNASVLYNAMVAPWDPFAVRAMIWYQGEANANELIAEGQSVDYYRVAYEAMLADWRERKGMGDFAVLTMQLPPSVAANATAAQQRHGRQQIRLAEAASAAHAGGETDISGTAVGLDLGGSSDWGIDHPPNKNEMARRLALQALHVAYALQAPVWSGPVLSHVIRDATTGGAIVSFANATVPNGVLRLRDVHAKNIDGSSNDCTKCCRGGGAPFELSADGKVWEQVPPERTTLRADGSVLLAGDPNGSVAAHVRYAWSDYLECVLENSANLPAGPFVAELEKDRKLQRPSTTGLSLVGPAGPALTAPPMGFNSWNYAHCNIDENLVKSVADFFVSSGLASVGYDFVNIDDCWQVDRLPDGTIQADPARFPNGMGALADYVHSKGLKFGLYTARGSATCQGRPGSLGHEAHDAATYCAWGIDYVKIDACWHAGDTNASWSRFHAGFERCAATTGHRVVQSVESCDDPIGCGSWVGGVADLWRTGSDIQATWTSVLHNAHVNDRMGPIARVGKYNDPDMLQVGNVGLSDDEQRSHFAMWCFAGAPLLAGTDLMHASQTALDILTATEVIAVQQDPGLGGKVQGRLLTNASTADMEVWVKPLQDGKRIGALLVNLNDVETVELHVSLEALGLPTGVLVNARDLYGKKDLGKYESAFVTGKVGPHACVAVVLEVVKAAV
jgi:hypothetical protein